VAGAGAVAAIAVGLVLRFVAGLGASEAAGIATVALTLVVIFVATIAALYTVETARAARETVRPLQRTADTLTALAGREEAVVAALDRLLEQARTEERRRELHRQLQTLQEMLQAISLMASAQQALQYDDFRTPRARLAGLVAGFPNDAVVGEIKNLAREHTASWLKADTGGASIVIESLINALQGELQSLA
jgi:Mg2+/Co2+ transporter CorB